MKTTPVMEMNNTAAVIDLMKEVVKGLIVNEYRIKITLDKSKDLLFATDLADYLVRRGIAFRDAHRSVGRIVRYAVERDKDLSELSLEEYRKFSPSFDEDVYKVFDYLKSVNSHDVDGGTALNRIKDELERIEEEL